MTSNLDRATVDGFGEEWSRFTQAELGEQERQRVFAEYNKSFHIMRTDALDRFGTRLEQRFTKAEIERMLQAAGLREVRFSDTPYWCAVGIKG